MKTMICDLSPDIHQSQSNLVQLSDNSENDKRITLLPSPTTDNSNTTNQEVISLFARPVKLHALDGIRGICSIIIVIGHIVTYWMPAWNKTDNNLSNYPLVGIEYLSPVTLFFVISGFTLVHVYYRSDNTSKDDIKPIPTSIPLRQFMIKRVARLAPIYYLSLLIAIMPLVAYSENGTIITSIVLTFLWLQSSIVIGGSSWNNPLWSVSAFLFCYLIFPSLIFRLQQKSSEYLYRLIIFLCVLSVLIATIFLLLTPGLLIVLHMWFPFRLPQFIVGVCGGLLVKRQDILYPTLYAESISVILLTSFIGCAIITEIGGEIAWFLYMFISEFILLPFHIIWLSALSSPSCQGITIKLLSSSPARALGTISYTLYCLHFPILNWCAWAINADGITANAVPYHGAVDKRRPGGWFAFSQLWIILPLLIVCITISTVVYISIEKPARRIFNKDK